MMTVGKLMDALAEYERDTPVVFRSLDADFGVSLAELTLVELETHDRCGWVLRDAVVLHSDEPGD